MHRYVRQHTRLHKKGIDHVDWVMSFSIFLFGVIVFMLIMGSQQKQDTNEIEGTARTLAERFTSLASSNVHVLPVLIPAYGTAREAVVLTYAGAATTTSGTWEQFGDYLIFLANATSGTEVDIYAINGTSTSIGTADATATSLTAGSLYASFSQSVLTDASFNGDELIQELSITDNAAPYTGTAGYALQDFVAAYTVSGPLLLTTFGFFGNEKVYISATPTDFNAHDVVFTYKLKNMTSYYASSLDFGTITYDNSCLSFPNATFLDVYDSNGILFSIPNGAIADLCNDGQNLTLTLSFLNILNATAYEIILHDGTVPTSREQLPTKGFLKPTKLTTLQHVQTLLLDGAALRTALDVPTGMHFRIQAGEPLQLTVGDALPDDTDVSVKTVRIPLIDTYLNRSSVSISVAAWQ